MAQKDVLDYIRQTPHNSNVNVVKGMLNGLDGGGDEGSGEFSTAKVTFINNLGVPRSFAVPVIQSVPPEAGLPFDKYAEAGIEVDVYDAELTIDVILYKNYAYISARELSGEELITFEGNAQTITLNKSALITGDCTVTISSNQ